MTNKARFAIRDDDLSFWTDVQSIKLLYDKLFEMGVKVSFAVIPNSVKSFYRGQPDRFHMGYGSEMPIGENKPLVRYLRTLILDNRVEIMLHGYDHTYGYCESDDTIHYPYQDDSQKVIDMRWVPECRHKSLDRMHDEVQRGRKYLSMLFDSPIRVFVPPSNVIGKVVRDLSIDICSSTPLLLDRGLKSGLGTWMKQKYFRLANGYTYPDVTRTKQHKEITAISLNNYGRVESVVRGLSSSSVHNFPIVLATHYWELIENRMLYDRLIYCASKLLDQGGTSMFVSEMLSTE